MRKRKCLVQLVVMLLVPALAKAQFGFEEVEEDYKGKFLGEFNSYHHQVKNNEKSGWQLAKIGTPFRLAERSTQSMPTSCSSRTLSTMGTERWGKLYGLAYR